MELKTEDSSAFHALIKLVLAKGVRNYFIMAGLMLYAQTLRLNTWWVGGTFNRKQMTEISDGSQVAGVVDVGYGQTQRFPHKTKKPEQVDSAVLFLLGSWIFFSMGEMAFILCRYLSDIRDSCYDNFYDYS